MSCEARLAHWIRWVERRGVRVARRRALAIGVIGLTAFWQAAALCWLEWPVPRIHDEFSYLLAADTFAEGRLSNPTHPLWRWFETFHVIQQPTNVSKYPPGQGLALAAGQILTGYPIVGAWLAAAVACALVTWMLFAWVPPRWALLGGILATVHPLILSWSHTYWGGSVAMAGGALLLGGIGRLLRYPSGGRAKIDLAAVAVGLIVLANSRPFEGLVLAVLTAPWLIQVLLRLRRSGTRLVSTLLPATLAIVLGVGWMALYNHRTTGSVFRMPYMVYEATYSRTPLFYWQPVRPEPVYQHAEMERIHNEWEYGFYLDETRSWQSLAIYALKRVAYFAVYELPGAFALLGLGALVATPAIVRSSRPERWVPLIVAAFFASFLAETARPQGHYAAPIFALGILYLILGLRRLRAWKPAGQRTGRLITRLMILMCVLALPWVYDDLSHPERDPEYRAQMAERAVISNRLERMPGRHLVLVRYLPEHPAEQEWVWNRADIDNAHVVWARSGARDHKGELLAYFAGRHVWVLEPDGPAPRLRPLP
ncbi:MAG: hypothetical protein U0794_18625 [Isosphaeraceae bacterium]